MFFRVCLFLFAFTLFAEDVGPTFPLSDGNQNKITSTGEPSSHTAIDAACYQSTSPWSVSQSGTWTVQQGTPPWSVSQSGAWTVTANAGTNLNTSALALDTSVNGILNAQGATTAGESGPLCQGAVTTGSPSYTTGKTNPLSLTPAGALRVDASSTTQPISGTVTANQGTTPWVTSRNWTLSNGTDSVTSFEGGSWSVTANAGTNLNTSALALDTSVNGLLLAQGSTTTSQSGPLSQGAVTTASPSYSSGKTNPLSLTTAGALRVDASATTQPVSGTVTANQGTSPWVTSASQSGTWTVQQGTPPWSVSQSGSWSVTATGKDADGVAPTGNPFVIAGLDGSGNVESLSVDSSGNPTVNQGGSWTVTANAGTNLNTSALALDTSVNGLLLAQASTTSGQKGPITQGAVTTNEPTYVTAQTDPISLTTSGRVRVDAKLTNETNLNQSKNFIADTNSVVISGTTETPVLLLKNPNASGKKLVTSLVQFFGGLSSTQTLEWRMYLDPTITSNGTSLTVNNMYFQTSPPAAVATAFKSPTISANGTFIALFLQLAGSLNQPEDQFNIEVDPNHVVLITAQDSNPNNIHSVHVIWSEE